MKKLLLITLIIPFISLAQDIEIEKFGLLLYFDETKKKTFISNLMTPYESNIQLREGDEVISLFLDKQQYKFNNFESLTRFHSASQDFVGKDRIEIIIKRNKKKYVVLMYPLKKT